jgi:DNA-binding NtrC family response regulator
MKHTILIVEDNSVKKAEIEKALLSSFQIDIHSTQSIAQAYRAIEGKPWDLIILDMTFQVSQSTGSGLAKEPLAGIELLQYLSRKRNRVPVIVATQHTVFSSSELPSIDSIEKLNDLLRRVFPENYKAIIYVNLVEEGWKVQLCNVVRGIFEDV